MKSPSVLVDEFKACVVVVVVIDIVIALVTLIESFSSNGAPKHVLNVFYGLVLSFADVCTFWFVTSVACNLAAASVPFIAGLRVGVL